MDLLSNISPPNPELYSPGSTRFVLELFEHQIPTSKRGQNQVKYYLVVCETPEELTGWAMQILF